MDSPPVPRHEAIEWLLAARQGDAAALDQLWRSCRDYLRLAAAQELPRELRAKVSPSDVVQDTLTAAQENLGQFRGQTDAELHAWLRTILRREAVRVRRRFLESEKRDLRREVTLGPDQDVSGIESVALEIHATPWRQLASDESIRALRSLIEALPEDYQRVVIARAFERRSFLQIALESNRTEGAVRKLWLRALRRLAQEWSAHDSRPLE